MAFSVTDYVNGRTILDLFTGTTMDLLGTTGGPPYTDANTIKVALFNNTISSDPDAAEVYSTSGEVSGTLYTAGGKTLDYPKMIQVAGTNRLHFLTSSTGALGAQATTVWGAGASFGPAYGCWVYNSTAGGRLLSSHYFGDVNGKTVVDGTFTITWNGTNGIFYATY